MKPIQIVVVSFALLASVLPCSAKTPTFTGRMVAYDPLLHAAKSATRLANREEIVLETPGHKEKFVKLVLLGVGDTQIDPKYFDGTTPLTVRGLRDTTCDEPSPRFTTEVTANQSSGMFLLTEAFKNTPPKIKKLECYDVTKKE